MSKSRIGFLLLITIFVVTLFLPKYYKVVFILRHLSVFLIVAFIIFISIYKNYKVEGDKKVLARARLLNATKAIVLLIGVSFLQIRFIDYFETPSIKKCYYYDEFGNYIHSSTFSYICSDLEVIEKTENTLKVKAKYNFPDVDDSMWSGSNDEAYMNVDKGYAETIVYIEYSELGLIDYYETQTTANYLLKRKNNTSDEDHWLETGNYSNKVSYDYKYFDKKVELTIETYNYNEETSSYENDNISHHDFSNTEPESSRDINIVTHDIREDYSKIIGFDIYVDGTSYKYGQITNDHGIINILLDYHKESNIPVESEQVIIDDDMLYRVRNYTKPFNNNKSDEKVVREVRYVLDDNLYSVISSTQYPIKRYNVKDKKIIKNMFNESIIEKTDIGYKVEVYNGDGYINERQPNNFELFNGYRISGDVGVLGINEPYYFSREYEPIFRLDSMLKYFVMTL